MRWLDSAASGCGRISAPVMHTLERLFTDSSTYHPERILRPQGSQEATTVMRKMSLLCFSLVLVVIMTVAASGQSFQVQCPASTITHPSSLTNVNSEPDYNG